MNEQDVMTNRVYKNIPVNIFPGLPHELISSTILNNIPKHATMVYRYTSPSGFYLLLTQSDLLVFIARNKSKQEIIDGEVSIYVTRPFGIKTLLQAVYKGPTGIIVPKKDWLLLPGQCIEIYFFHPTEIMTKNSQLVIHATQRELLR